MKKEPYVKAYFDDEEKILIESMENVINKDDYVPVSNLTSERLKMFREAAKNTLSEKTTQITLRIPHTDLVRLKAQAIREGIPYQPGKQILLGLLNEAVIYDNKKMPLMVASHYLTANLKRCYLREKKILIYPEMETRIRV